MSKLIDATIKCPKCGKEYPVKLFRTIWGEHETNRNLVMNDEINVCTCNSCGFSFKASYPFMYVDVKEGFAVWWEPFHDNGIDADTAGYAKMFGAGSYYATAPRIANWETFKETIQKYYRGELKGGKIEKYDISALTNGKQPSNKGCLTLIVFFVIFCAGLTLI
ncbi:hypothetical protein HPS57_04265 [Prevotella sp. PINT]|jgi:hypothetical protein|uniref:CpXC domain-containing protein n=1 Tax=Palleniella intestinalis TaxID=2736291 RepID=UPI001555B65B|nr:CpXC domain-containing protein [Palleniella intestinalis]NPD81188.1 hypothetical protein [Palleniella intestinalis]